MLATIYIYGHLVAATFSMAMVVAFAVSALRVPGARDDWWTAVLFTLTATTALAEMKLAAAPSLTWGRALLAFEAVLIFFAVVAFHAQHAAAVFGDAAFRRHRAAVVGYAVWATLCVAIVIGGIGDSGALRPIDFAGVHTGVPRLRTWAFVFLTVYAVSCAALQAPLLLRDGPKLGERRMLAVPTLLIPLFSVYELLLYVDVNPLLPIGGYFAASAGVIGAFVLAERFKSLMGSGTVGSYTILGRLGSGGMADVFLARRSASAGVVQRVALKRLRPEHVDDPNFARMFLDEARIAARLLHPNIVTLLDVGQHGRELYLAMELVDGAPLSRMLQLLRRRGTPLGDAAAVEVALQVADALTYAHAMLGDDGRPLGLVHRDVSPHNVLVDRQGHVKLADFGIARTLEADARTRTGVMKGKISYMAPEQVQTSRYDERIDVYALGVVLFEMLANRMPYHGSSEPTVLRRLLDNDPEPHRRAAGLPPPLGPIVARATHPRVEERLQSAAALREVLLPLRDERRGREELVRLVADTLAAMERRDDGEAPTVVDAAR